MNRFAQTSMQFVINMRSSARCWKDLTTLSGDIMDEDDYMRKAIATKNRLWTITLLTYKSLLAFHFGYFEMAASIYDKMEGYGVYKRSFNGPSHYFYGALIFCERYRATRHGRHLRRMRNYMKALMRFEAAGCPNVSEFLLFLKAEVLSLKSNDVVKIIAAYNTAIDAMKKLTLSTLKLWLTKE